MSECSISALRKRCMLMPITSIRWQGIIRYSLILSAVLSVSLLFPACTKLGAWDLIASAGPELVNSGPNGPKLSKKRIPISLAALAQSSSLSNFPILVRLQPNVFPYADCRADGLDIRFRASDGTDLAYERDSWNKGGTSDFWVKIPTLAVSPQETRIWIYFGDDTATDGSNAAGVWTNGYLAVLHGSYEDIAGVRYYRNGVGADNPNNSGGYVPPADLGGSSFIGGSGFRWDDANPVGIKFPDTASFYESGPLSFEVWLWDHGTAEGRNLFFKGKNSNANLYASMHTDKTVTFVVRDTAVPFTVQSDPNIFTNTSWTHFALVWDGILATSMYSNGTNWGVTALIPDLAAPNTPDTFVIGNDAKPNSSDEEIKADLDEIRISNVERSGEWIKAQYLSQLGTKLVFGAVEDVFE